MPNGDKDFILKQRIDLALLKADFKTCIQALKSAFNDEIHKVKKMPEWLGDSWSPRILADKIRRSLRRSSAKELANIEKHLRGENYAPIQDDSDKIQAELDNLDRAVMFWEWGEYLLAAQRQEYQHKLNQFIQGVLVVKFKDKIAVECLEFSRGPSGELTTLIARAELHSCFWRVLLCVDQHLQGKHGPLAELVGWANFKGPDLDDDEKNRLKSGPMSPGLKEKIYEWLWAATGRLAEPLPKLPPEPLPQPPGIKHIYLNDLFDQAGFGPYERICLALPQVSGFCEISDTIKDHRGTRRGYTNPETGAIDPKRIPQYDGVSRDVSRYGVNFAENNYRQSVDALTKEYDPQTTLYIIALPEYYYPRYVPSPNNMFDIRARLKGNLPKNCIFISGLEGKKVALDANDRPTSPPSEKKLSKALVLVSPGLKAHFVGYDKIAVFLNTPLGAIGISTYDSLSSLGNFWTGLKYILGQTCLHLSYLFVCCMNNPRFPEAGTKDDAKFRTQLGNTRLVVTKHDSNISPPYTRFENYSRVYDKDGMDRDLKEVPYDFEGCSLYSKVFIL